eukprot:10467157-Lingulodinium_polyedra.AAC.1
MARGSKASPCRSSSGLGAQPGTGFAKRWSMPACPSAAWSRKSSQLLLASALMPLAASAADSAAWAA